VDDAAAMIRALHLATSAAFVGLMTWAAVEDCRRLVIPNGLILALLLLWPIHLTSMPVHFSAALAAAGGGLAVFLAGALLHARGLVGGGDVKLFAAAALWAGSDRLPALLLVTGLCGGALSLLLLSPLGRRFGRDRRATSGAAEPAVPDRRTVAVPYGAAIAGAALFVTLPAVWG
jgi:prepilin peptidase CpaA